MRFLLTLAAMALPVCAQGWYNPVWRYRKAIEIDRSTVACDTGTIQANFPALIALTNDPDLAAHARWDGSDILFTAGDGTTKLDREVESFTWNSGTLLAWVRIPALNCAAAAADTTIYIYYGSPAGTELNAATVWDSHYLAVLHFANAQAPGKDSTGNHNDGTVYAVTSGAGMTGNGGVFDGSTSHITGGGARIQGGEFTLQAWIHPLWASGTVLDIGTDTGADHLLHFYQRSDAGIWLDYTWDTGGIEEDSTVLTGAWNFVASRLSSAKALTVTKNLGSWGPFNVNGFLPAQVLTRSAEPARTPITFSPARSMS